MKNHKPDIISQAWHFEPLKEGYPSMVLYSHDTQEWRIQGETIHDLTGIIKPNKCGVRYVYNYYISNCNLKDLKS